jgi:repressor LexA
MAHPTITRRQREILDFYVAYCRDKRMSPTLDEVAQHFGVNRVTIFGHVAELEKKGLLMRSARNVSRGLSPSDESEELPGCNPLDRLRLLGEIAAGSPIEALESPQPIPWTSFFPDNKDLYLLRVKGTSMIEDHIQDGDLVVVEHRNHARDGEIVVAILPGEEATLKRVYREDGGYRLQPSNSLLEPRYVEKLEIRGVVVSVLRSLLA